MSFVLNLQQMDGPSQHAGGDSAGPIFSTVSLSFCLLSTWSIALCIP
ncbi:SapB/AmfS family lanthipeptide [Virgisporangium aurantiacum]|uniref:Uncharacterized protein n=1 Tax=Virgisporangium aurantiacum TaxID=175570 RepID=A0A8J4E795_9ACTN|nr:SapB/AmfS family lanthipeptide [Virgisporangium aurantiacum]GIJ63958.1 hypothetical protein Vau01_114740 [Virgisporangium aurantiacum]